MTSRQQHPTPNRWRSIPLYKATIGKLKQSFEEAFGEGGDRTKVYDMPEKAVLLFNVMRRVRLGLENDTVRQVLARAAGARAKRGRGEKAHARRIAVLPELLL